MPVGQVRTLAGGEMKVWVLLPILWAVTWSIYAVAYAVRPKSKFRWGAGGKGPFAPGWLGRTLFILGAIYCTVWAFVSGSRQVWRSTTSDRLTQFFELFNQSTWPIVIDCILLTLFSILAYGNFLVLKDGSIDRRAKRSPGIVLSISAAITIVLFLNLVFRLVN